MIEQIIDQFMNRVCTELNQRYMLYTFFYSKDYDQRTVTVWRRESHGRNEITRYKTFSEGYLMKSSKTSSQIVEMIVRDN